MDVQEKDKKVFLKPLTSGGKIMQDFWIERDVKVAKTCAKFTDWGCYFGSFKIGIAVSK